MSKPDIYFYGKNVELVEEVIATVSLADDGITWSDLMGEFTEGQTESVKRITNHLIAFGAFQKRGKYTHTKDTRLIVMTELGHAWLLGRVLPRVDADPDYIEEYFNLV